MIRRLLLTGLGTVLFLGGVYLAGVSALAPLRQETLTQPRVFAYRDWQHMGVLVEEGDRVTIRASGEWLYTPGEFHGPEGHARYPAPSFYPIPHVEQMGRGVPGGVLIGRIGEDGTPFVVGRRMTVQAAQQGALFLRINDDILSDNEGWVAVEVSVQPAADKNP